MIQKQKGWCCCLILFLFWWFGRWSVFFLMDKQSRQNLYPKKNWFPKNKIWTAMLAETFYVSSIIIFFRRLALKNFTATNDSFTVLFAKVTRNSSCNLCRNFSTKFLQFVFYTNPIIIFIPSIIVIY